MGLCWLIEVIISLPYLEEDEVELLDDDILRGNYTMTGFWTTMWGICGRGNEAASKLAI
jgi:hypothetical protein